MKYKVLDSQLSVSRAAGGRMNNIATRFNAFLCALCVSAVKKTFKGMHRRGAEYAEKDIQEGRDTFVLPLVALNEAGSE